MWGDSYGAGARHPDHTRFLVLYDVDYIDPQIQNVTFKVWR